MLPKGATIVGSLQIVGNGEINGLVKGNVTVGGKLVVGANAEIKGTVHVQAIEIRGSVVGDIFCIYGASIAPTAVVKGDVTAAVFDIKEGALIDGQIIIKTEAPMQDLGAFGSVNEAKPDEAAIAMVMPAYETPQPETQPGKSTDLDRDAQKWF